MKKIENIRFAQFRLFSYGHRAVSKVVQRVILNLFQDPYALLGRSRNKFGMTAKLPLLISAARQVSQQTDKNE